jgi:hypothetical protein
MPISRVDRAHSSSAERPAAYEAPADPNGCFPLCRAGFTCREGVCESARTGGATPARVRAPAPALEATSAQDDPPSSGCSPPCGRGFQCRGDTCEREDAGEKVSRAKVLYFRGGLGIGIGNYGYPSYGNNASGFLLSSSFDLGLRYPSGLLLAAVAAFEPIFGLTGSSVGRSSSSAGIAPGAGIGVLLGYDSGRVLFSTALELGGGGGPGVAGGIGVLLVPYLGISLGTAGRVNLQLFARPALGFLSDPVGAFALYSAFSAGLSLVAH